MPPKEKRKRLCCVHPDCDKPSFAEGLPHGWLCWRHYDYWTKEVELKEPDATTPDR